MNKLDSNGFAFIPVLIAVAALIVVGGSGAYVYHKDHKTKTPMSSNVASKSSSQTSTKSTSTSTATTTDSYAGWQSYCDPTYHYCFKYPAGWIITAGSSGTSLMSPTKTVQVTYGNSDNRDGGLVSFTPTYIQKLTAASQDVTVVGGYYPTSGVVGNYAPLYSVVDSSLLTTYPLTVGTQSQFVNNAVFTDAGTSGSHYGDLTATPAISIDTMADATAWLDSADAKTSLQILQSFNYQQ